VHYSLMEEEVSGEEEREDVRGDVLEKELRGVM
jgi:hypothetical protein